MKESDQEKKTVTSRRTFLSKLTLTILGGTGLLALFGSLQLPFPRVFRESFRFKVGRVIDFPVNTFTFIPKQNIFVLRERQSIRALSATCSHLGCIVQADDQGFLCPCHGSRYDRDGNVLFGPAPFQLNWLKVSLALDGQIMVDTSRKVSRKDFLRI